MKFFKPPMLDSQLVKDTAIFFGWITGILLIAGICWSVTQPVRNRFLLKAVNRVLEQSGDSRRLGELFSPGRSSPLVGAWYTMSQVRQTNVSGNETSLSPYQRAEDGRQMSALAVRTSAFVFPFIGEGTFFPCVAVITEDGKVEEFIPLNSHGEKILSRISPGILRLYERRIEKVKS